MDFTSSTLFRGTVDMYRGVTVNSQDEPCEQEQLLNKLSDSLKKWHEENKRCIWFNINIKDAAWVPVLANEGFHFHHSRDNFVMMYKWLPEDSTSNLPPACHTNMGVGGLVLNNDNEILVVSEQHYKYPHWKLPGGYVERGEDIKDAAIREVKEETGIDAAFESVVTLRHTHNMMFGNSDIYIVVLLKALTSSITKSDIEIKACQWMPIDEFLNHPHVHDFNRFLVTQALNLKDRHIKLSLDKSELKVSTWSREVTTMKLEDIK